MAYSRCKPSATRRGVRRAPKMTKGSRVPDPKKTARK